MPFSADYESIGSGRGEPVHVVTRAWNYLFIPFLKPLAPRRIRKRACPFSESPEKPSKKIKQGLSTMPSDYYYLFTWCSDDGLRSIF